MFDRVDVRRHRRRRLRRTPRAPAIARSAAALRRRPQREQLGEDRTREQHRMPARAAIARAHDRQRASPATARSPLRTTAAIEAAADRRRRRPAPRRRTASPRRRAAATSTSPRSQSRFSTIMHVDAGERAAHRARIVADDHDHDRVGRAQRDAACRTSGTPSIRRDELLTLEPSRAAGGEQQIRRSCVRRHGRDRAMQRVERQRDALAHVLAAARPRARDCSQIGSRQLVVFTGSPRTPSVSSDAAAMQSAHASAVNRASTIVAVRARPASECDRRTADSRPRPTRSRRAAVRDCAAGENAR